MAEGREGSPRTSKSGGEKIPDKPLFPQFELSKLDVPESVTRLRKMARDASLDPDAAEQKALGMKTKTARIRGVLAAGKAKMDKISAEHPELDKTF